MAETALVEDLAISVTSLPLLEVPIALQVVILTLAVHTMGMLVRAQRVLQLEWALIIEAPGMVPVAIAAVPTADDATTDTSLKGTIISQFHHTHGMTRATNSGLMQPSSRRY